MRFVNLASAALEAEILRYKSVAARQARRAGFGLLAFIFVLGFLTCVEITGWQVARMFLDPIYATLCMMGVNLVIAVLFLVLAMRSNPSKQERDAVEFRQRALKGLQTSLAISTVVPLAGALWRRRSSLRGPADRLLGR
jgi:ribose/xylose/arabinose/galactoside ABC-type transport system permease subunit